MKLNESWRRPNLPWPVLMAFVFLLTFSLGGCGWWEKNIVKPVKGFTDRRLTITTDPPGADVFINDVFQGKSPLTVNFKTNVRDLLKGFIIVVQKEGYLPVRREVNSRATSATFRLIRKRRRQRR